MREFLHSYSDLTEKPSLDYITGWSDREKKKGKGSNTMS